MEMVEACGPQFLCSKMIPLVQRKVISSGPVRKEKLLTMSLWPLSWSPPHFFFLYRKSGLRCQAVSWGPSPADSGGHPQPKLHSIGGVQHWSGHSVVLPWQTGMEQQHVCCTICNIAGSRSKFQTVSSLQTNSWVETKPYREALSHATEAVSILTIHRVNVTDTGPYSCNVTSIDTTQTQQTQVIVYGKH